MCLNVLLICFQTDSIWLVFTPVLKHRYLDDWLFHVSENRFKIAISFFKNQYVHDTLKKCGFLQTAKIFTFCIFNTFKLIYWLFFINTNNQVLFTGSSLFFKTHMWIHFFFFSSFGYPSTINCDSCLEYKFWFMTHSSSSFQVTPNSFATSSYGIPCLCLFI